MITLDLSQLLLFISLISLLVSMASFAIAYKLGRDADTPTTEEDQPPQ